jgi:hypothetical protein
VTPGSITARSYMNRKSVGSFAFWCHSERTGKRVHANSDTVAGRKRKTKVRKCGVRDADTTSRGTLVHQAGQRHAKKEWIHANISKWQGNRSTPSHRGGASKDRSSEVSTTESEVSTRDRVRVLTHANDLTKITATRQRHTRETPSWRDYQGMPASHDEGGGGGGGVCVCVCV